MDGWYADYCNTCIIRATEDEVAGADETIDGGFMAFQYRHTGAGRHVPLADCLVGTTTQYVHVLDQDAVDVKVIAIVIVIIVIVVVTVV